MVHGEVEADPGAGSCQGSVRALSAGVPTVEITAEDGNDILSLLVKSGLCASKSDARRNVQQGGVAANETRRSPILPRPLPRQS